MIDGIPSDVPVINFLTGNPALLPLQRQAGGQVIGLDWRVNLKDAWGMIGYDVAVQGNLDPVSLYADLPTLQKRVHSIISAAEGRPGHIFNLGHGVMPDMDPGKRLIAAGEDGPRNLDASREHVSRGWRSKGGHRQARYGAWPWSAAD